MFSMATYQVKVEYGEKRFCTFLITEITLEKLFIEIKKHCSLLAHLPSSCVRVKYRDEDGDMVNLIQGDEFSFNEILRSARDVKDREYKKIYLLANEIDSPMPCKVRRLGLEAAQCAGTPAVQTATLQPKHLAFSSAKAVSTPQQQQDNSSLSSTKTSQSPLDAQKQELQENLQLLKVQLASAKDEIQKLNDEQKQYQSLNQIRGRLCNNCHTPGHTKTTCCSAPCTDITQCKIKEKHPESRSRITQLQREVKSLESKVAEEETHYKTYVSARERAKSSFFAILRPRLKAQNPLKYGSGNRLRLDHDLLVLQRALNNKVPEWNESEDWRLPMVIEQFENSTVKTYMNT